MDAKGDFVVSYTRNTNNNNPDIFAKLYNTSDSCSTWSPMLNGWSAASGENEWLFPDELPGSVPYLII